ncbi:FKBP-type peptidyl-prolyl cis-trans isomerase [Bacteroidota bacterium]
MRNSGLIFLLSLLFFTSCVDKKKPTDPKKYKEPLIKINKYLVGKDYESIKSYTERHGWNMQVSETGLWYEIKKDSSINTQKAVENATVIINYKVKLLNSKICYSSDSLGPKTFKISYGGVEPGLEEGILMMNKGDKARFIMPPHLAHGLLGDGDKIPVRATIIYEVELIDLSY